MVPSQKLPKGELLAVCIHYLKDAIKIHDIGCSYVLQLTFVTYLLQSFKLFSRNLFFLSALLENKPAFSASPVDLSKIPVPYFPGQAQINSIVSLYVCSFSQFQSQQFPVRMNNINAFDKSSRRRDTGSPGEKSLYNSLNFIIRNSFSFSRLLN